MAARLKALVAEARWRGLWGTVRAVKMNKMGTQKCFGTCVFGVPRASGLLRALRRGLTALCSCAQSGRIRLGTDTLRIGTRLMGAIDGSSARYCFVIACSGAFRFVVLTPLVCALLLLLRYCENQNPDSLNVTPEWHAWLHHNTDDTPTDHPLPKPDYQTEVTGNPTGTKNAYVPPHHKLSKHYAGAASEKYETWTPSAKKQIPNPEGKDVFDLK